MRRLVHGLDADQRAAVLTDATPLAVIAAAGSGKTTVLTRRIARRITDGSASAAHVLALTFTRDAAGELHRRLRRLDVRERIEAGTFHAVALRLLRDRAIARHATPPAVATDRVRLIREVCTEARVRAEPFAVMADIDWVRARLVPPFEFAKAARAAGRRPAVPAEQLAELTDRYGALKRRRRVVDFDDLLDGVSAAIRDDPVFADVVRWRFRHVFVDEAQDLNPLQFRLLTDVLGTNTDVCLVGDHRQAIYGWNGADPASLTEVERRFPGVTVIGLVGNQRCSPEIVRAGSAALAAAGIPDDTESRRDDGRPVRIERLPDDVAERSTVVASVRDLVVRHGAGGVAVLARTNDQLRPLADALAGAGLPVSHSAAVGGLDAVLTEVGRLAGRERLAEWVEQVWTPATARVGRTEPSAVDTDADADADTEPGRAPRTGAIRRRVAEEIDRFLSSGEPGSFRAWVEARHPFDDLTPEPGARGISLLTFHAAKGREWPAVVVTGVEVGLVPHVSSSTAEQRREEARLLYVALTRASDELVVTAAARRNGRDTGPSPWLGEVEATIADATPVAAPAAIRRPARPADPLTPLRVWRDEVARRAGVAPGAIATSSMLRALQERRPVDAAGIAAVLGLSDSAARRLAPGLLDVLAMLPDEATPAR
jgi:DNA helicase-2/ATP-dependent DNA helicase PcrA